VRKAARADGLTVPKVDQCHVVSWQTTDLPECISPAVPVAGLLETIAETLLHSAATLIEVADSLVHFLDIVIPVVLAE
jgi:hypothetical protein